MKQKILLIVILNITVNCAFAQTFIQAQKVIGGSKYDELHSTFATKDGGLIAAGTSYSNKSGEKTQNTRGGTDYWVVKMNKAGKIEWDKTIGGNGNDYCKAVIQTLDGGYVLVGESNSFISVEKSEDSHGSTDYWIVKLDSAGNIEWDKTIGGIGTELIDNVVQTDDGSYVLAGSSDSYASWEKSEDTRGSLDMWVVKLNKLGKKVWDKTIGGNDYDLCSGIQITRDGGVILAGFSGSNASGEKSENNRGVQSDFWIVKLNKKGNIQWDRTIGGSADDYGRGVQQTKDGGYVIAGNSNSNISGEKTENSRGGYDYWIIKLDSVGRFMHDKTIGGDYDEIDVWCLEKTSDNGFIFGGSSYSGISGEKTEGSRGASDYWVIKLDSKMNLAWDKTIGGDSYDNLLSIKETGKNMYALGGFSWSGIAGDKTIASRGEADFWIVALNETNQSNKIAVTESTIDLKNIMHSNEIKFTVYPNPAKDIMNIRVSGKAIFSLSDASGKIVRTKTLEGDGAIDVSALAAGMYYLKNNTSGAIQNVIVVK
jgi:hypothetical protein